MRIIAIYLGFNSYRNKNPGLQVARAFRYHNILKAFKGNDMEISAIYKCQYSYGFDLYGYYLGEPIVSVITGTFQSLPHSAQEPS